MTAIKMDTTHTMPEPFMFFVAGTPRPQPRPRFVKGRVISTASKPAKLWRVKVERTAKEVLAVIEGQRFDGALAVEMVFSFMAPVTQAPRVGQPHTQRPDSDNLAKGVMDAMQSARLFADDAAIATLTVRKIWDIAAGCTVLITPIAAAVSPGGGQDGQTGGVGYVGSGEWMKAASGLPLGQKETPPKRG